MGTSKLVLIFFIPIISALIGWFTNYIAIKSLFKPIKPVNIFGFKFQGLIPKEKNKIILKLSKTISDYLISNKDLLKNLEDEKNILKLENKIIPVFKEKVEQNIRYSQSCRARSFSGRRGSRLLHSGPGLVQGHSPYTFGV